MDIYEILRCLGGIVVFVILLYTIGRMADRSQG